MAASAAADVDLGVAIGESVPRKPRANQGEGGEGERGCGAKRRELAGSDEMPAEPGGQHGAPEPDREERALAVMRGGASQCVPEHERSEQREQAERGSSTTLKCGSALEVRQAKAPRPSVPKTSSGSDTNSADGVRSERVKKGSSGPSSTVPGDARRRRTARRRGGRRRAAPTRAERTRRRAPRGQQPIAPHHGLDGRHGAEMRGPQPRGS